MLVCHALPWRPAQRPGFGPRWQAPSGFSPREPPIPPTRSAAYRAAWPACFGGGKASPNAPRQPLRRRSPALPPPLWLVPPGAG